MRADATATRWPDCCSFSPSVGQTLPRQRWHVSGLVTDSSLSQCRPLSKAHMDRNKGLPHTPRCMHTHTALIKEQQPQLFGSGGRGGRKEQKWVTGKLIIQHVHGSNFSNVGICKGLCLIPGAKWNVSSLLFNQHSCHFHTSRSHCANSKHSSQPRPLRRCGASGRWSEGGEGSPAEALGFNGFKMNLSSWFCLTCKSGREL